MLLVLPTALMLGLFFVYPVGVIISRTFTDHLGSPGGPWANLDWFLSDPVQRTILLRTFTTAGIVTVITLSIGYPFAYLLTTLKPRARNIAFAIVVISCWQSILARNYSWRILLRDDGVINSTLAALGLGRAELLGTTTGVLIGMTHVMAPFMILPLYASMRTIDLRLVMAAEGLGASRANAFLRVYVPLSLRGIVTGSLLVFVISLGFFITPALLGSPRNSLLSQAIAVQVSRIVDWGHAGAMSLVLLVATLLILGLAASLLRHRPSLREVKQ